MPIQNADHWTRTKLILGEAESSYFRRRAAEERSVALSCDHPRVRQAHSDMAERYEDVGRAIAAFERHLGRRLDQIA